MAKFDISDCDAGSSREPDDEDRPKDCDVANREPARLARLGHDSTQTNATFVDRRPVPWGIRTPHLLGTVLAIILAQGLRNSSSRADPIHPVPDPPSRRSIPSVGPGNLTPSWDLDSSYLWLGPS